MEIINLIHKQLLRARIELGLVCSLVFSVVTIIGLVAISSGFDIQAQKAFLPAITISVVVMLTVIFFGYPRYIRLPRYRIVDVDPYEVRISSKEKVPLTVKTGIALLKREERGGQRKSYRTRIEWEKIHSAREFTRLEGDLTFALTTPVLQMKYETPDINEETVRFSAVEIQAPGKRSVWIAWAGFAVLIFLEHYELSSLWNCVLKALKKFSEQPPH